MTSEPSVETHTVTPSDKVIAENSADKSSVVNSLFVSKKPLRITTSRTGHIVVANTYNGPTVEWKILINPDNNTSDAD